jgi:hypothetical protein
MTARDERVVSTDPGAAEDPRGDGGAKWARRSLVHCFVSNLRLGGSET